MDMGWKPLFHFPGPILAQSVETVRVRDFSGADANWVKRTLPRAFGFRHPKYQVDSR